MVLWTNMTSYDTNEVITGKIDYLIRTAKSNVNVIGFLIKFQNIFFILMRVVRVRVRKGRKSLSIQNGGPKFATFAYFIEIFHFFTISNKIYTCNQPVYLLKNNCVF